MLTVHRETIGGGVVVCRAAGEVDAFTVGQFRQALADLDSARRLVIDLSGVSFIDSAGLGALIGGIRRTRELGGNVAVACNRVILIRLLRSTGFDRIVTVAIDIGGAIEALNPGTDQPAPDPDPPQLSLAPTARKLG